MNEKKKENILKVLIGVLLTGLVVMVAYTFNFHREKNESIKYLEEEKVYLQTELKEIQIAYDSLELNTSALKNSLKREKTRITILLDSINNLESNFRQLKKYRLQAEQLKIEKQRLLNHINTLAQENKKLKTTIDSTNQILQDNQQKTDSLNLKNEELKETIEKASVVQVSDIHGEGVFLKNNGEVETTRNVNKIENIRICFHLNESKIVPAGEKKLYIQIINPENNLIGEKKKENFNEKELYYSTKTFINYRQIDVEVCALISIASKNAVEGKYIVHIFDNEELLSSSSFVIE
jgi:hypothetical protein